MAKDRLPVLIGVGVGAYLGYKAKRPLLGAGVGFLLGSIGAGAKVQGPAEGKRMGWGDRVPGALYHGYGANIASRLPLYLGIIAKSQPNTPEKLKKFFLACILAGRKETGKVFGGGDTNILLGQATRPSQIAPLFGKVKQILLQNGATQTANALTQAAAWYYHNVELPARGGGAVRGPQVPAPGQGFAPPAPASDGDGWWKRQGKGAKIAYIVGGLSLMGALAYFALAPTGTKRASYA